MLNQSGLKVTGDKVLVCPLKVQEKTSGGIILPEVTKAREELASQMGVLVDIGPHAEGRPELDGIGLGDVIFYPRYRGADFPVDGVRYWVMRVDEVLGKVTKLPDFVLNAAQSSAEVFGIVRHA
jgi:chaperonin GroES